MRLPKSNQALHKYMSSPVAAGELSLSQIIGAQYFTQLQMIKIRGSRWNTEETLVAAGGLKLSQMDNGLAAIAPRYIRIYLK